MTNQNDMFPALYVQIIITIISIVTPHVSGILYQQIVVNPYLFKNRNDTNSKTNSLNKKKKKKKNLHLDYYSSNLPESILIPESEEVHSPKNTTQLSFLWQIVQCIEQAWAQEHAPEATLIARNNQKVTKCKC